MNTYCLKKLFICFKVVYWCIYVDMFLNSLMCNYCVFLGFLKWYNRCWLLCFTVSFTITWPVSNPYPLTFHNIVACTTVAMQRLGYGCYIRPVSGQLLRKHVPKATVTHATGETGSCLRGPHHGGTKKSTGATSTVELCKRGWEEMAL
jgi:hypothetical protein